MKKQQPKSEDEMEEDDESLASSVITGPKDAKLMQSSNAVLGADSLLQLLKNYARTAAGSK